MYTIVDKHSFFDNVVEKAKFLLSKFSKLLIKAESEGYKYVHLNYKLWMSCILFVCCFFLLGPRERWQSIVMSMRGYLWNHTRDLYQFSMRVADERGSVLLRQVTKSQGKGAVLGGFLSH